MKKRLTVLLLTGCFLFTQVWAQNESKRESAEERDKRMDWCREARFGMFIHFGVYAQFGGVYRGHEQIVKNGGNLLFNVGPTSRGVFDNHTKRSLDSIGYWMGLNGPSIYGCTFAPDNFKAPEGTRLTYNPKTKKLYVHLFDYPRGATYTLPGYKSNVRLARVLSDGSELRVKDTEGSDLVLIMPAEKPEDEIPVIELSLND